MHYLKWNPVYTELELPRTGQITLTILEIEKNVSDESEKISRETFWRSCCLSSR